MQHLSTDDQNALGVARAWLQRKGYSEASIELDKISEAGRLHPDVLEATVGAQAGLKNHLRAIEAGRLLVDGRKCLDRASVWLTLADSLHQLDRTQEAYDILREFALHGHTNSLVYYRLAVYACLLGKIDEAKAHFTSAMATPEGANLKREALQDQRLQTIWDFLCKP